MSLKNNVENKEVSNELKNRNLPSKVSNYDEELFKNAKKLKQKKTKVRMKYKQLCEILEQPRVTGKQKQLQLKKFARYFDFEYDTKKKEYVIHKVYETPLPADETAHNSIYSSHTKILLLSYLLKNMKEQGDGVVYVSAQKLYEALGMINEEYYRMMSEDRRQELRRELQEQDEDFKKTNIRSLKFYIDDFYQRSGSKLSSILHSTLDTLDRKNYIRYSKVYILVKESYTKTKDPMMKESYTTPATDAEISKLLEIERLTMNEFKFDSEIDIWFSKRRKEYYDQVLSLAQLFIPDLIGFYRSYKIISTERILELALSKENITQEMKILNQKIINFIDNQAENKLKKSQEENSDNYKKVLSQKYLDAQLYLSDKLIKLEE